MPKSALDAHSKVLPLKEILKRDGPSTLGVIIEIDGPSYQPVGAMMAVFEDKTCVGNISSGCIEADLARHAIDTL